MAAILEVDNAQPQRADQALPGEARLLVLSSINSDHSYLIRAGKEIAERRGVQWMVVWVDTGQTRSEPGSTRLRNAFALARELGAETAILRGPDTFQTIVPYIEQNDIRCVLVGAGALPRFPLPRKRLYRQLIDSGLPVEVAVIRDPVAAGKTGHIRARLSRDYQSLAGYVFASASVLVVTLLALGFESWISNVNMVLVFVLAVVVTGIRYGSRAAIAASILAFLSFNFFLTDPRYTFEVARRSQLFTLIALLLIGLVCGPAASRIRRQIILLREANRSSEAQRLLAQELAVAGDSAQVWQCVARRLSLTLGLPCCIAVRQDDGRFELLPATKAQLSTVDESIIDWTLSHRRRAGRFGDAFASAAWSSFPITKEGRSIAAALILFPPTSLSPAPQEESLITAMLQQGADTCQRVRLAGELESARVKSEVEQLRAALMSSVSHDLKTPLAAMMGAAESLRLLGTQLEKEDRESLENTIIEESRRMESYIQNLLDMTRLGYGTLKIERDWVSIADIVGSAISRLKRYFPKVATEYHSLSQEPLLYAHAALVEQALFNILENAARYSPIGEAILISVDVQKNLCVIAVEDKGPGIPPDEREKVFEMFHVASEGDRKRGGTGMGLAICRGMIGTHSGLVHIEAGSDGRGTRVLVSLPMNYPTSFKRDAGAGEENV